MNVRCWSQREEKEEDEQPSTTLDNLYTSFLSSYLYSFIQNVHCPMLKLILEMEFRNQLLCSFLYSIYQMLLLMVII